MKNKPYVYIYLDNRKPGLYIYREKVFYYQPFYVGVGTGNRINSHLKFDSLINPTIKNRTILKIQKSLGCDPIRFKIYENLTYDEAFKIEKEIINLFGRRDNNTGILANLTNGGEGVVGVIRSEEFVDKMIMNLSNKPTKYSKKIIQKTLTGEIVKIWDSLVEIKRETSYNLPEISAACKGFRGPISGFIWEWEGSYSDEYFKLYCENQIRKGLPIDYAIKERRVNQETPLLEPVYKYSKEGKFIEKFDNAKLAANSVNLKIHSWIVLNCKKENSLLCGFQWFSEYRGEFVDPIIDKIKPEKKIRGVNVYQYKDGMLINSFKSFSDAAKKTGIPKDSIGYAARKPFTRTAFGYQWSKIKYDIFPLQKSRSKPIMKFDANMNLLSEYTSAKEIAEEFKFNLSTINEWARNKLLKYGFVWAYSQEYPELSKYIFEKQQNNSR